MMLEEAYERLGYQNVTGYHLKSARKSLNIYYKSGETEVYIIGK